MNIWLVGMFQRAQIWSNNEDIFTRDVENICMNAPELWNVVQNTNSHRNELTCFIYVLEHFKTSLYLCDYKISAQS